jgi:hypothetical protein
LDASRSEPDLREWHGITEDSAARRRGGAQPQVWNVRSVAAVYNRYSYQPEMRAALEAWARRVREIKTGETASNVVDFRPAVNERS